jgi:hypothetical protein
MHVDGVTIPLTYRFLIQFEALECLSRATLVEFLRPFELWCAENGIGLDGEMDRAMLGRIHYAMCGPDVERPGELSDALLDLGGLAGRWGAEEEVQRAIAARRDGMRDLANPVELAFREYIERREQFFSIAERVHGRQIQRLVEFCPSTPRLLEGHEEPERRERLELDAGRFFGARNRTRFCECRVVESSADIQFEIVRGSIPRRHRTVVDEARLEAIDYVPARSDFVIFDKRTRMLSVHAQQAAEHDYYRRLFGRIYFGTEDHFRIEEVYTGEPLALRGEDALSVHGFPHLDRIELRELRVQARAGFELIARGSNVRDALPTIFGDEGGLSGADVQLVKLAIYVKLRRRPIVVAIKPPNWCSLDRRIGEDLVRAFLVARGFLKLPAIDPPAEQLSMPLAA